MRVTLIGYYLICVVLTACCLVMCTSCAHRTYESVVRDTVIVHTVDSVIINMREVEVEVPVPQIHMEQWVPIDTLSVLDNGLYTSTVEVVGGQIHHQLKPSANADGTVATIPGTVVVSDTTVHHSEHVSEKHESTEKEKVVQPTVDSWWIKFKRSIGWFVGGIVAGIVLSIVAWLVFRRKI